jgi:hypothetical protein
MINDNFCQDKIEKDFHGCVLTCNQVRLLHVEGYWKHTAVGQGRPAQ